MQGNSVADRTALPIRGHHRHPVPAGKLALQSPQPLSLDTIIVGQKQFHNNCLTIKKVLDLYFNFYSYSSSYPDESPQAPPER
jgi:hypothetical protein